MEMGTPTLNRCSAPSSLSFLFRPTDVSKVAEESLFTFLRKEEKLRERKKKKKQ